MSGCQVVKAGGLWNECCKSIYFSITRMMMDQSNLTKSCFDGMGLFMNDWLVVWNIFFPSLNSNPNLLSYFSEGLAQPPTRWLRKSPWASRRRSGWKTSSSRDLSATSMPTYSRWLFPTTKITSCGSWIAWTLGIRRREQSESIVFCLFFPKNKITDLDDHMYIYIYIHFIWYNMI